MNLLITNGSWISPGTVHFYGCPSCNGRRARYVTRQLNRSVPYDGDGQSPVIPGAVFFVASDWISRSGLTWSQVGNPTWLRWWALGGSHRGQESGVLLRGQESGVLLQDPRFLIIPSSLAFTAGDYEVVLAVFKDRPPIKALKGDGPFEIRTSWASITDVEEESRLCLACLHKEVEAHASNRQGHLTLALLTTLSEAAQAAVAWLQDREPAAPPVIFNHRVEGATVRTHSGRVALIDAPTEGEGRITSPDHPEQEIVLPREQGPWVAVHPWPQKGVD